MLAELCKKYTKLSEKDIKILESVKLTLQYTADLVGTDIFINCLIHNSDKAVVVAEAKPSGGLSAYNGTVVGQMALRENEPAVFRAFEIAMPIRDLKAITQENKSVKQDVVPIINSNGMVIAVLIKENDVSNSISKSKKLDELAKTTEHLTETLLNFNGSTTQMVTTVKEGSVTVKEIHHRIKNNLQMVASILNIQARRSSSEEVKKAFKENISRVLSIAAIHDILTKNEVDDCVGIKEIINKITHNIKMYAVHGHKSVAISVEGDDIYLSTDKAASIALVINELISNSIEHAFLDKDEGAITVSILQGNLYSTITVSDNGNGFDITAKSGNSLGLDLVMVTVKDKLKGNLRIMSDTAGTRIMFDFKS